MTADPPDIPDDAPYRGLKVFEIAQGYAAPLCGMMLAQHGAEVVKLEPPHGDWARGLGRRHGDLTAIALVANAGKKSLALDLKSPAGRAVAARIAAGCDVLVDAGRPGVADRLGLGYAAVSAANPAVVYVSVSGFGQTGPYVDRPCTDTISQSHSGLMSVNRGMEDGIPHRTGPITVDHVTGLYAFQAVQAALYARQATGRGRFVDVSLMAGIAAFLAPKIAEHHLEHGTPRVLNAPAGSYRTRDGWIAVTLVREKHWEGICAAMERLDLTRDPRFADFEARAEHLPALLAILHPAMAARTTDEWLQRFERHDVLANRINDFGDWLSDPQVRAVDAAPMVDQPGAGPVPFVHIPGAPKPADGDPRFRAPVTGEHSRQVLAECGFDAAEIDRLVADGVVVDGVVVDGAAKAAG